MTDPTNRPLSQPAPAPPTSGEVFAVIADVLGFERVTSNDEFVLLGSDLLHVGEAVLARWGHGND
jgi:hypothetical protein